jgi:AraC-like DNA-binding protein
MVRLGNVCHLYENSNATLLSLALDSGFDSLRTFNRNFKKFYGMPPKEYFKSMGK